MKCQTLIRFDVYIFKMYEINVKFLSNLNDRYVRASHLNNETDILVNFKCIIIFVTILLYF